MKAADMLPLLEEWARRHDALDEADQLLADLTGRAPESKLFEAMWGAFGGYTAMLETLLIGSVESHWLEWYQFECDMGAKTKDVQLEENGPLVPIRTLDDLARLLEALR